MRILIAGAGAVGGYFGGRLLEKGEDVAFLVRDKKYDQLQRNGLFIKSVHGDVHLQPKLVKAGQPAEEEFDVILISVKAYHLEEAIRNIKPFAGAGTSILPLLNGISHMDMLEKAFGKERLLGGLCFIESTLNDRGEIVQKSDMQEVVFGEMNGKETERISRIRESFSGTKASFRYSSEILSEMWSKYLFISMMSGLTTLTRSPVGPIRETAEGRSIIEGLALEILPVMQGLGADLPDDAKGNIINKINAVGYHMKSSMQRDMEKDLQTESAHFFKYLLDAASEQGMKAQILNTIYMNLQVYEKGREKQEVSGERG
jgi:2-dehydropantoate 2-reductase